MPGVLAGWLFVTQGMRGIARAWIPLLLQAAAIAIFFLFWNLAMADFPNHDAEIVYFGLNPLGWMEPKFIPWTGFMLFFVAVAKTFVPWNLSATYGYAHLPPIESPFGSWMAIPGLTILLVLLFLIAWRRTRRTPLGIGSLVFLILYFPVSKIPIIKGLDYFGERWLYAPSIGLSMIGGYVIYLLGKRNKNLAAILCIAVVATYAFVLIPRNLVWRNMNALGESMLRSAPQSVVTYDVLANERLQQGRTSEAWELIGKGLQITRMHVPLHHTAAAVALDLGLVDLADQAVTAAEELGGGEYYSALLRSTVLAKQGKFEESLATIEGNPWFNPFEHRTRFLLALNLWRLGRADEAQLYFDWDAGNAGPRLTPEQKIWVIEHF